jgi:hypothetical protein
MKQRGGRRYSDEEKGIFISYICEAKGKEEVQWWREVMGGGMSLKQRGGRRYSGEAGGEEVQEWSKG